MLRKYYRLKVKLAYLVDFAQFLPRFALHFTFLHFNSLTLLGIAFSMDTFIFSFMLVSLAPITGNNFLHIKVIAHKVGYLILVTLT